MSVWSFAAVVAGAICAAAVGEAWLKRGRHRPLSRHAVDEGDRKAAIDRAEWIKHEGRGGFLGFGRAVGGSSAIDLRRGKADEEGRDARRRGPKGKGRDR